MKRSNEEGTRARYEDALRHDGREAATRVGGARHVSKRHPEPRAEPRVEPRAETRTSQRDHDRARDFEFASHTAPPREDRVERRGTTVATSTSASQNAAETQDAGVARLAKSRHRKAQHKMHATTALLVVPTIVASLMLMATAHVVFRDWRSYETEARIARSQRDSLREQLDTGQRRLRALRSVKGREQVLAERGYVPPGDRLLLFPADNTSEAARSSNDISNDIAARRAVRHASPASAWTRAARAMTGWLSSLSGAGDKSDAKTPASAPTTSAPTNADEGEVSPEDRIVRPNEEAAR